MDFNGRAEKPPFPDYLFSGRLPQEDTGCELRRIQVHNTLICLLISKTMKS
jgi:hypothetical protein